MARLFEVTASWVGLGVLTGGSTWNLLALRCCRDSRCGGACRMILWKALSSITVKAMASLIAKHHGNRSTRRQPEGAGLLDVVPHIKNDLTVCAERRVDVRRNTDNPLNPELS